MLSIEFFCPLPNGLHARPAWALKEQCSAWRSDIRFINRRLHTHADAKSSLALISTGTLFNDSCVLEINGSDEEQARRVLEAYLTGAFIDSDSIPSGDAPHVAHPLPRSLVRLAPHLQHGITLASGIGAGTLRGWQSDNLKRYCQIPASPEDITRLEHSLATLAERLNHRLRGLDGESKTILSAHLSLIQDEEFGGTIRRLIAEERLSLAEAIIRNMELICDKLSLSASDYLRERVSDIRDISEQLLNITWPELQQTSAFTLSAPTILVAEDLTPSQFLSLDTQYLKGMVLEKTGRTSHTLILARAASVPVLSGLTVASLAPLMGKEVLLDGICSVLVVEPNDAVNDYYSVAQRLADRRHQQQIKDAGLPALTRDNVPVEIAANIGSALEAPGAFTCGAQGIGLFRTEMLYMDRDTAPDEQEQFEAYQQVLLSAQGKPVIFRTMDIGGDKQIPYL
ncbi:HPr family phosphocarrier protein, partial [Enterobacter hormaechei]